MKFKYIQLHKLALVAVETRERSINLRHSCYFIHAWNSAIHLYHLTDFPEFQVILSNK